MAEYVPDALELSKATEGGSDGKNDDPDANGEGEKQLSKSQLKKLAKGKGVRDLNLKCRRRD